MTRHGVTLKHTKTAPVRIIKQLSWPTCWLIMELHISIKANSCGLKSFHFKYFSVMMIKKKPQVFVVLVFFFLVKFILQVLRRYMFVWIVLTMMSSVPPNRKGKGMKYDGFFYYISQTVQYVNTRYHKR